MLCFFCNKRLIVAKKITTGDTGLLEVDIQTHCHKCNELFKKQTELQDRIDNLNIEMRWTLREYRDLAKNRLDVKEELNDISRLIHQLNINE